MPQFTDLRLQTAGGLVLRQDPYSAYVSVPVLAALGVAENGQNCLLDLRIAASEAAAAWGGVITSLQQRGLAAPLLLVAGNRRPPTCGSNWDAYIFVWIGRAMRSRSSSVPKQLDPASEAIAMNRKLASDMLRKNGRTSSRIDR